MGYTSFYGGRKGASFVIVKNYPDIPTMTQDFAQGNALIEVGFDEYVLINTYNKNHPDNGKIFKRGYDYNSDRTIEGYRAYNQSNQEIINGTPEQYKKATYKYEDPENGDDPIEACGAIYIGTIVGPAGLSPHL